MAFSLAWRPELGNFLSWQPLLLLVNFWNARFGELLIGGRATLLLRGLRGIVLRCRAPEPPEDKKTWARLASSSVGAILEAARLAQCKGQWKTQHAAALRASRGFE